MNETRRLVVFSAPGLMNRPRKGSVRIRADVIGAAGWRRIGVGMRITILGFKETNQFSLLF